jgi:hypothetical protein
VLRPERSGESDVAAGRECIERMGQVGGDRRGMRQQGNAPAVERRAQSGLGDEAIDAELHDPISGHHRA